MSTGTLSLGSAGYQLLDAVEINSVSIREGTIKDRNNRITVKGPDVQDFDLAVGGGNDALTILGGLTGAQILTGAGNDLINIRGGISAQSVYDMTYLDDNNSVIESEISQIAAGSGNDTIRVGGSVEGTNFYLGDGNDSLTIRGVANNVYVSGDGGNDFIQFNGASNDNVVVQGGTGNDTVIFTQSLSISAVELGADNDLLILAGGASSSEINTGSGKDSVRLSGFFEDFSLHNEGGNDLVTISSGAEFKYSSFSSASLIDDNKSLMSNDTLIVGINSAFYDSDFYMGDGNDFLSFGSNWLFAGSTINLGTGSDTLVFGSSITDFDWSNLEINLGNDNDIDHLYFTTGTDFTGLSITGIGDNDILYVGSVEYSVNSNTGDSVTLIVGNSTWYA